MSILEGYTEYSGIENLALEREAGAHWTCLRSNSKYINETKKADGRTTKCVQER
jgi:hypothetical protein